MKKRARPVYLSGRVHLAATDNPAEFRGTIVKVGRIRNILGEPGPFIVSAAAIQDAVNRGLFEGLASFVDHPGWLDHHPKLSNLAGVWRDVTWSDEEQGAVGTLRFYTSEEDEKPTPGDMMTALFGRVVKDAAAGLPVPDVGVSIVFWATWAKETGPDYTKIVERFRQVLCGDCVFYPATDSRIKEALSALSATFLEGASDMEIEDEKDGAGVAAASPPATVQDQAASNGWLQLLSATAINGAIRASGLPQPTQARLLAGTYRTADEVTAAIEAARTELAALQESQVVQMGGVAPRQQVTMGINGFEELQAAAEALILGQRPARGVRPLSGIRELYLLLSGDYEMHGVFHGDRIQFASVSSSTMAEITANVLNKAVVNAFLAYEQWWKAGVTELDFTTLQNVEWITLGGIGELPTVNEGQSYPELTWDDQGETSSFVKKGGYVGITLEAMDKDQTGRLQAAPRALARAAWMTLGKTIAAIFTSNSNVGPTMSDGNALFSASHASGSNLGSTALSWAAWDTTRIAMEKFTELNSGERLGGLASPKLLWVPTDLETTALQILGSLGEPGTGDNDTNPFVNENERAAALNMARRRVIKVPFWTDTNNWAAQADPNLYPSIGIGYRFGRTPEVFSVASPTAGLMFTADTMPVKVRFFFACGPTDWRGLYKHNVA